MLPFSKERAEQVKDKYKDLLGTKFQSFTIEPLFVIPFGEDHLIKFRDIYRHMGKDLSKTMISEDNSYQVYAWLSDGEGFSTPDIRTLLTESQYGYDPTLE
jgi:hypothetical protein